MGGARTLRTLRDLAEEIKVEHTLFGLPLALSGAILGAGGIPEAGDGFWVVLAMAGARTAAMAFNRLADEPYDRENPRTRQRPFASGRIGRGSLLGLTVAGAGLLVLSAWRLNPLALRLSPLALAWVFLYSFSKRVTWVSHLLLGVGLAMAPVGGWIGVRGEVAPEALLLGGGTALWVAGFDVIYACLDYDFDRSKGLHSLPVRFGIGRALAVAALLHGGALGLWAACGAVAGLGGLYFVGLAVVALLFSAEHLRLRPYRPCKVMASFFPLNAVVSVVLLLALSSDLLLGGGR